MVKDSCKNSYWHRLLPLMAAIFLSSSCQKTVEPFEPNICYYPSPNLLESRSSAFSGLGREERQTDWGKQLRIAYAFVHEQDYYRAITAFKSALVFLPVGNADRKWQIEYGIVEAYYLGCKYQEAIENFEGSSLLACTSNFPAYRDLLITLYDAYMKSGQCEKAEKMLELINSEYPCLSNTLELSTAMLQGDFCTIESLAANRTDASEIYDLIEQYQAAAKSAERAQLYQALLPGAGYYYVGQTSAARTSLIINALFIWAAYNFFEKGYFAAGLITASIEAGWYLGGINGARLAAKEYNERLWGLNGREFMRCHQFFPLLMLETTF